MATLPLAGVASGEAFGSPDVTDSNVLQFRSDFPEFASTTQYPDTQVLTWLTFAATFLSNGCRWGALLLMGQELVAAHYLVLQARDQAVAALGATPGTPGGLQTAKSVGDISTSYDYARTTYEGAGFWNLTSYGQRYYTMARMFGAGGIQL